MLNLVKRFSTYIELYSLVAQMVKRLSTMRETLVRSLGWEDPWRRKWQPTPVLLPGKSHGWRSLVGYSPWGHRESDTTERLHSTFILIIRAVAAAAKSLQLCPTLCDPMDTKHTRLPCPSLYGTIGTHSS